MRTEIIKKGFTTKRVEFFDGIKELTTDRYVEYLVLALEDIGIGSEPDAIGKHFSNLYLFAKEGKTKEVYQETRNLNNTMYLMIQKINLRSLCLAPFIHTINGKEVFNPFDHSTYNHHRVKSILHDLEISGLKQSQVTDILEDVKKNLNQSLEPLFLADMDLLETPMSF